MFFIGKEGLGKHFEHCYLPFYPTIILSVLPTTTNPHPSDPLLYNTTYFQSVQFKQKLPFRCQYLSPPLG